MQPVPLNSYIKGQYDLLETAWLPACATVSAFWPL